MNNSEWLKENDWVVTDKLTSMELQHLLILFGSCNMHMDIDLVKRLTDIGIDGYLLGYDRGQGNWDRKGTVVVQHGVYKARDIIVTYNDIVKAATEFINSKPIIYDEK